MRILSVGGGICAGVAILIASWWSIASVARPRIEALRQWDARLEAMLRREIDDVVPADVEPSSFEVMADAYKQLPYWLSERRKGGIFREPGYWTVMFVLLYLAWALVGLGVSALTDVDWATGVMSLCGSGILSSLALFVYLRWRKMKADEDAAISGDWATRLNSLTARMEKYLGSV